MRQNKKLVTRKRINSPSVLFRLAKYLQNQLENFRTYIMTRRPFIFLTRRQKPTFFRRYLVAFLIVIFIATIRVVINHSLAENVTYIVFTFAVVISAWYGGIGTGVFATFLCLLAGIFFSFEQGTEINLMNGNSQFRVILFILQGIFISLLTESVHVVNRWHSVILESISDAFITYDRNMRFVYLNQKAEEVFQLRRESILGKHIVEVYPGVENMLIYKNCKGAMKKQIRMQFEMYIDQSRRWYQVFLYPSEDGVSAYFQDITRRRRIERKLKESQLRFRRLFEANIIGIIVANAEGRVYQANDLFLQMTGYTRSDLRENRINWKEMTPPEYQEISNRSNEEVLKKGMSPPFEKEYIRKDGQRIHILMGKVLLDKTDETILALNLDISEQKNLERKKNEFISIASHELKTPLTTIKAFTQILLRQKKLQNEKQSRRFLQNIDTQVEKLNVLISDLLDVSKIEAGKLSLQVKELDLTDLVKRVVDDYQYIIQSHTIMRTGKSRKKVLGDEHRLEQVLINLLSNAIKYSPGEDKVIIHIQEKEKEIIVSVQDFGIGIAENDKMKVFERFFRSDKHVEDVGGFGLGLYISKEIIDRHGGKLWVDSIEGKGSTFYFSLPIIEKTKAQ